MRAWIRAALIGGVLARAAAAQDVVGHLPDQSVIRDLNDGMRAGWFAGWMTTGRDPVGVRAHSAPIVGIRYDLLMGSPAYLSMRVYGIKSTHDVYDPTRPGASRYVGTAPSNHVGADASVELSLVGERTWHGFQPLVRGGLGVIAGVANRFDQGSYAPGISMVYLWGAGVRIPVFKNSDIRIDANYMVHQVRYPNAFRFATASDTIPLRGSGSMTPLTVDRAITASWTWGVFR